VFAPEHLFRLVDVPVSEIIRFIFYQGKLEFYPGYFASAGGCLGGNIETGEWYMRFENVPYRVIVRVKVTGIVVSLFGWKWRHMESQRSALTSATKASIRASGVLAVSSMKNLQFVARSAGMSIRSRMYVLFTGVSC